MEDVDCRVTPVCSLVSMYCKLGFCNSLIYFKIGFFILRFHFFHLIIIF